jgi:uncharacterized membrane protein
MANCDIIMPKASSDAAPVIRKIEPADLLGALKEGLDDFWAMPTHVVFLGLIYPVIGLLLGRAIMGVELIPLLYPITTGFALIGPFAAIGLYELSRRREAGMDTSWKHAFDIVHSPSLPAILALGTLLLSIFVLWIAVADAIYVASFGTREPTSLVEFTRAVLTTREGYYLIIFGNAVGFVFAVLAFSLSVVSFPLLLDRNVGFATAIITSVRAVLANPLTMSLWGLIVATGLLIGSLPLLLGLAIVMPVLGHSTWHLYRRVVEADPSLRPEFEPKPKSVRYAADFPSCLFAPSRKEDV